MVTTLEQLYSLNHKSFQLTLTAGAQGKNNVVNWIYMLEDENIIPYFQGGELIVTTGVKQSRNSDWLLLLVQQLHTKGAAGLIVNTGKFVSRVPHTVIEYCNANHFPLLTMPWEIQITKMTQALCLSIIKNQQNNQIHDQAMQDAILHRGNEAEYREILASYYDLEADFTVIAIYAKNRTDQVEDPSVLMSWDQIYRLETRLHHFNDEMRKYHTRLSWIQHEKGQLAIINHSVEGLVTRVSEAILQAYEKVRQTHDVYLGIGSKITGLSEISKSFERALTAVQMAVRLKKAVVSFDEMGIFQILLSCKDKSILSSYANKLLEPLDHSGNKREEYLELLECYIENDRSLEKTADALFLHRNTVNYRLQKLKELLNSPLKTVEDLFPYYLALLIRDKLSF